MQAVKVELDSVQLMPFERGFMVPDYVSIEFEHSESVWVQPVQGHPESFLGSAAAFYRTATAPRSLAARLSVSREYGRISKVLGPRTEWMFDEKEAALSRLEQLERRAAERASGIVDRMIETTAGHNL